MNKINFKKTLIFTLFSLMLMSILTYTHINNNKTQDNYEMIVTPGDENDGIGLNAKEIRLKNIGDKFILSAKVNENATFQNLTFVASNNTYIRLNHVARNACEIIKLKDFLEVVTITVFTDDPFDDLEATCSVRAYNRIDLKEAELEWNVYLDKKGIDFIRPNEIVFIDGAFYEFSWKVGSIFKDYKYNEDYPNTYCFLEEEDLNQLQIEIEGVLNNPIKNVAVDDSVYDDFHVITFEMIYENDVFSSGDDFEVEISMYDSTSSWKMVKYQAGTSLVFEEDLYVI